jgi:hypothetical protein
MMPADSSRQLHKVSNHLLRHRQAQDDKFGSDKEFVLETLSRWDSNNQNHRGLMAT